MGMNIGSGGGEADPIMDINTTPLIDVMLVLIIMLIITIPPQLHAVQTNMPRSNNPNPVEPPKVEIQINAQNRIFWNGEEVAPVVLNQRMIEESARGADARVLIIKPDNRAKYETVAYVIANTQRNNITKMTILGGQNYQ